MAVSNLTTMAKAFKTLYSKDKIFDLVMAERPLLGLIPKSDNFKGESIKEAIIYGYPQGRSATFSNALAQITSSKVQAFEVTRKKDYGIVRIDNEALEASEGNEGAFFALKAKEMKNIMASLADNLWYSLYGDGTGTRAIVGAESTTSLTLATLDDVSKFEVGMEVGARQTGAGAARTGTATITAINRETGVLTSDANWTSQITSLAATDELFVAGDKDALVSGLSAWIPSSAPGATAFYGVDRSVDPVRLGGIRYNGTGKAIHEAIVQALHYGRRNRAQGITHAFIHPTKFAILALELENRVRYVREGARGDGYVGKVSFEGIEVATPYGKVNVYPDEMCQNNVVWLLNLNTWKLRSLNGAPRLLNNFDKMLRTVQDADELELRAGYYANLCCAAPGFNIRCSID